MSTLQWPSNTHSDVLSALFGHGDGTLQPGWTLDTYLLPHLVVTAGPFGQNPQHILIVWSIHVVSELDTDLRGCRWEGRAEQTRCLSISHIVSLVVDIEARCRQIKTDKMWNWVRLQYFYSKTLNEPQSWSGHQYWLHCTEIFRMDSGPTSIRVVSTGSSTGCRGWSSVSGPVPPVSVVLSEPAEWFTVLVEVTGSQYCCCRNTRAGRAKTRILNHSM